MKKCIVLDLDNTLWGGVVGEDGPEGIALGLEPPGSCYLAFQQALLDLHGRGVILAIASKNNYDDAMQVIREHPYMVLREDTFAAMRINWGDKAENVRELAEELNIGLDSLVFLDDDPANRSLARAVLPEVETPDLPGNPAQYAKFLMALPYFEGGAITDEDKMRGNLYVTERMRMEAEGRSASREKFLEDLGVEVRCYLDDASCLPRLAQMTERTNQFNMCKRPIGEEEIAWYINDPRYRVFHVSARDNFGDYGVIGFALGKDAGEVLVLESFLMSCRALGRGVEEAFFHFLSLRASNEGKAALEVVFEKTEKNKPAEEFLNKYFDGMRYNTSVPFELPSWVTIAHLYES